MEHHLRFWEAGFPVFPLHSFSDGRCGCGDTRCLALGKHPRSRAWQHTPIWDDEQMETMQEVGHWDSGYGVLCKGLLVVDVDVRNGGEASYAKLIEAIPEIAGAGLIVKSGRGDGGRHLYFSIEAPPAMMTHHADYPGLDFKSSGYVVGPGSKHAAGGVYTIGYGSVDDIEPAPAALIDLLRKPDRHRAEYDGRSIDVSQGDIADMLSYVDPDCAYDTWIRIGMSIHHATGGTGLTVWDEWSGKGSKYDADCMEGHWHSFGRSANPATLGTLIYHAQAGGWIEPVTFGDDPRADDPPEVEEIQAGANGLPFDDASCDLTKPPGYLGQVAAWIEGQTRRSRKRASVGTALWVASCLFAEYTDDLDNVNGNIIAFVVAGSGTGKEGVQKAGAKLLRIAGYAPAMHGTIKSEKEIVENLLRHQVAHYQIDEVGELLLKIRNASRRGGASHHEGTIGLLMSAFSKADNFLLIGGDRKEEARATLTKEAAALEKKISENENVARSESRLASVQKMLASIQNGIDRPYLTLIGYTVPQTFDQLMDYETATNGFMRRAIVFSEQDTAPPTKRGFRPEPLPEQMEQLIRMIGSNGVADEYLHRIELADTRRTIPTNPEAAAMLAEASLWFDRQAITHKSRSGLEALFLGAYEQVSKVSMLLGAFGGVREPEHVRWAFRLIRADVEAKALAVTANDRVKSEPKTALQARILSLCGQEGETAGVIRNRCRSFRKEDVDKELAAMMASGRLVGEASGPANARTMTYKVA